MKAPSDTDQTPPRVLMIAPTPFFAHRGTHIRILEQARALIQNGWQVHLVTYHHGENINIAGLFIHRVPALLFWYQKKDAGPSWQKIILDILMIPIIMRVIWRFHIQLLHAHLHEGVLIAWLVQRVLFWQKIKLIADFHGSLTNEMRSHGYLNMRLLEKFFRFLESRIHGLGHAAIASSSENAAAILPDRPDKTVHTVSDIINTAVYRPELNKELIRQTLQLPVQKKIICYTGALLPNKGIDHLIAAMPAIMAAHPDTHLLIAGEPRTYAAKLIQERNLPKNVTILSPLSYFDLPKILHACDLAVDPKDTTSQQASGKILAYMAAGLPVVCFDRPTNRQYLQDGAYYCHPATSAGLAQGIIDALHQENEWPNKSKINKQRATHFSGDVAAQKIVSIYQSVCR